MDGIWPDRAGCAGEAFEQRSHRTRACWARAMDTVVWLALERLTTRNECSVSVTI